MKTKSTSKGISPSVFLGLAVLTSFVATLYVAPLLQPSFYAVLVKLLPCLSLLSYIWHAQHAASPLYDNHGTASFLYLLGIESKASTQTSESKGKDKRIDNFKLKKIQMRRQLTVGIARGLVFSMIGDAFLVWHEEEVPFLLGLAAFAVAQVSYIRGLGFQGKVSAVTGFCCYSFGILATTFMLREAPAIFLYTAPLYAVLLTTTLWRTIDRCYTEDGREAWQPRAMVVGAATFVLSDASIAAFKFVFVNTSVTVAQTIILATYFTAQTLLTVGAV